MNQYFSKQGRALLSNGYLIVPITPGHKRPSISGWQHSRIGVGDLSTHPNHGVGVLTGQGAHPICAIDVDVTDEAIAAEFTDWCRQQFGMFAERIGKAPKILLVFRAAEAGWSKASSSWFEDEWGDRHRVEILGNGQQFVAYHEHPETGKPYEWVDLAGGLEYLRADELPVITLQQVEQALKVFEQIADAHQLVRVSNGAGTFQQVDDDPLMTYEPPIGIALGDVTKALTYIDCTDYDTWVRAGMALHHEFGGDASALDAWDEWSKVASNYTGRSDLEKRWVSFGNNSKSPATVKWILKAGNEAKRQQTRIEKRQGLEELKRQIESCDDSLVLLSEIAEVARLLIAETPALRPEVVAVIRSRYRQLTNVTLPAADLAQALREPAPPTVKARRPLTEFGNAERMLDKFGNGLMFVPELGTWYCWTGIYWRKASTVEIQHYAKETIKSLVHEIEDHPDPADFFKFCATSQVAKMVANMVTLAQSDPRVMVPADELDKHTHLMGAQNGVINLQTGELLPPDPELRITRVAGCDYNPKAKAPLFEQTVLDVFNDDQEMAQFFQRLVGYAAMGQPTQDVMVIPHGNGSNGKSTVLGSIRNAFGSYAKAADAGSFVSEGRTGGSPGGAREDLVRLKGARFVYVNEPDENSELREGSIKAMTGGDALPARGVYGKESIEITPTWVVFMPTNHKPIVKGSDNGIWRRLMLIPFTRNFEDDLTIAKDPNREEKLRAELEGILTWVVQGARQYQADGLKQVGAIKAAREAYRNQMDLLAEWLEECCELGGQYSEESNKLWKSWEEYARNRGLLTYVKNAVSLGRRLDARFPAIKLPGGKRMRVGLRVRSEFDDLV